MSSRRLKDTEDVDEQINNIQVKVDGGKDVFLWRQLLHQYLETIKQCYFCRMPRPYNLHSFQS
jgi:hypothetical protein